MTPEAILHQTGGTLRTVPPVRSPLRKTARADPLPLHDPLLDDEAALPRRSWIGGQGALPHGRVSIFSGPPGVSKTTFVLQLSMALAMGQQFSFANPDAPVRVLVCAIEDDVDELRRRAHAMARLCADAPHLRALVRSNLAIVDLATHVPLFNVSASGLVDQQDGFRRLVATIQQFQPDVLVLDPLIEIHTAQENDNTLLRPVLREMRNLAAGEDRKMSVLIVHHETKAGEGSPLQRMRGGGGIGGAIRAHFSLRHMTEAEATEMGIPDDLRDLYLKLENGKLQYSRRQQPVWLVTEERELANGDRAHLLVPWSPPKITIDTAMLATAERAIRDGWAGEPCSESNKADACYRQAFDAAGIPKAVHTDVLTQMINARQVEKRKWHNPETRKSNTRLWADGSPFEGWKNAAP